ncbi:MAG TPA: integrase arm-type DNA-binding domain-containing protein [Thermohalobaculum sp.]|nr:integrase arm-type DNA-binding domain-containing protein [Thermohalobaculum sp.]
MGKLTAKKVEALKQPGHYVDGDGLALVIGRRGGKSWVLRTMVRGKRRDIGLGGISWVSLAEAREKAGAARKVAREGGDPIAARQATLECPTFEEAARKVHGEQIVGTAKNEKHRAQWINTLRDYAFPLIGSKQVRDVAQADVLAVLAPIWTEKPETARRVRQRIRTVLNWARTAGHFEGVNPVEGVEKGLAKQKDRVTHHAAMPWAEVPRFLPELGDSIAAQALHFLILTAARTGEVIGARWSEIDYDERLWTIPAERMKAQREHRVPLTEEALAVLERVRGLDPDFVFPGQRRGKGLSNMAMTQLMRRLGRGDVTVHGFRSSFRDWAEEKGGLPREIAELSLAHEVGNATERAYRRSDLLGKHRTLMERWARFCCPASADVIQIGGRA